MGQQKEIQMTKDEEKMQEIDVLIDQFFHGILAKLGGEDTEIKRFCDITFMGLEGLLNVLVFQGYDEELCHRAFIKRSEEVSARAIEIGNPNNDINEEIE